MPIYEYQCQQCEERLEVMQRLSEEPLKACPECGGDLKKLISVPAFQFKGSGWYVTDYARKSGEGAADAGKSDGKSGTAEAAAAGCEKSSEASETSKKETSKESKKPSKSASPPSSS